MLQGGVALNANDYHSHLETLTGVRVSDLAWPCQAFFSPFFVLKSSLLREDLTMAKNFGLNLNLIENRTRRSGTFEFKAEDYSKQAEKDFSEFEREMRKHVRTSFIFRCKTYLCNWEGNVTQLTRGKCPCCGGRVFSSPYSL